jgi:hypothetical protein
MTGTIAYRLTPVRETEPGGIATAAVMTCMATGRILSGMGGGGLYLAPEVVDALRATDTVRVVCDGALHEALVRIARGAAQGHDVSGEAKALIEREGEAFA